MTPSARQLLKECSPFDKECRRKALATAVAPRRKKKKAKRVQAPEFEKGPAGLKEAVIEKPKPRTRDVEFRVTREGKTVLLFKGEITGKLTPEVLAEMRKKRGDKPLTTEEVKRIQAKFATKIKGG